MKEIRPQTKAVRSLHPVTRTGNHVHARMNLAASLESLRDSVGPYKELYEHAPVGILKLDRRGCIIELNETAARLLGFPMAWLLQRPFLVFVARHDVARFMTLLTRGRQRPGQQTAEIDLFVDFQAVPVQMLIRPAAGSNALTYQMVIVDLSEKRRIEKELGELKEVSRNWHSLIENASEIIMMIDRSGEIAFVNRSAWGYSTRALIGTRLSNYVLGRDRAKLEKCIAQALDSRELSNCEVSDVNDEKDRWYNFGFRSIQTAAETEDPNQKLIVTIREISEYKRNEESLRASREQLRELLGRLDAVREDERTRVAREIHDELGQALTILKMDLSWLHSKAVDEGPRRKKIKSMITYVDQTIERVRRIVSELRPSILDELGLIAAIEWQLAQFQERTGIRGKFESNAEPGKFESNPDVTAALFRVVQEALTNVMRHAGATEVSIKLKDADHCLRIAISDNGRGITHEQINDRRSFGIVGMRERIHRIGGTINIYAPPGRGTRLEISTP